jgi:ATP-binding cassette subfamily B protein
VKKGDIIALVGPTGVGKTTIASLLERYYDPIEGRILIDGIDIKNVTLESLRNNISIVLQDIFLFNGTIAENVSYGVNQATMDEIVGACKLANAHEFIENLESGYNTIIGERGIRLSGGQKQRISIARAVLRDSPILILDEATSSVDVNTEKIIHEAMDSIVQGRTTIIIAHRLSSVKKANMIIVLDEGSVKECGTHEELIAAGGLYEELCNIQFSKSREEE